MSPLTICDDCYGSGDIKIDGKWIVCPNSKGKGED